MSEPSDVRRHARELFTPLRFFLANTCVVAVVVVGEPHLTYDAFTCLKNTTEHAKVDEFNKTFCFFKIKYDIKVIKFN